MKPYELADQLAKLDWSTVSLQHRLALTAAINELRAPGLAIPTPANDQGRVVILQTQHWVRLLSLDGAELAKAPFTDVADAWRWVTNTIATLWNALPDQVHCAADDYGTIDGIPVCQIVHGLPEPIYS